MASFISQLLARFKSKKPASAKAARRSHGRRLLLESMESRRLLAGDIGSIAGNVFTDLTDDGLTVDDTAIVGATVNLYNDDGSTPGALDGTDTLITSDTTDANGDYSFADLTAGDYIVEQVAFGSLLQRVVETTKAVTITEAESAGVATTNIDTYNDTAQVVTAAQGLTAQDSTATGVGEALGGERDILVTNTGGVGAGNLQADTSTGVLVVNTSPGAAGSVIVTYDGVDGDATTIDHGNLAQDLTAGGGESFHFLATSEAGNTLTVNVYSSSTNFSTLSVALPVTGSLLTFENLLLDFADFVPDAGGSGADFTSVTAIRMELSIIDSADARIDFTQVVAPFVSTQNFPNLNPMSIGNSVFNDANNNGVLDGGETGIAGVDLALYTDDNLNGSFDAGDTQIATTTTDGSGNYVFGNLFPGEYIVVVPDSNFATAADALFGFSSSTGTANAFEPAPDPDIAVTDNDDNGTSVALVGVVSTAITLASGTEPTTDGDTDTNTNLTLDFGFAPEIDLFISKTASAASIIAGNQVTYTLTIRNDGDAPSSNVLVVDDLPDFLTIDSVTASGGGTVTQTGNAAGEIEVAYANLAAAQEETITIVATVPADQAAATAVTNTATIAGDGIETDATNNTDTADIDITRQAVLVINKSDTPDPIAVGSQLTYTIDVTNNGPSTATNVVVSDTLPAGLTFDSVSSTAGTASEAAGVITVNVPTLAVDGSFTVTVLATIQTSFSGSTITNSATADADEAALVTSDADTTVSPQVDLSITKSDADITATRGEDFSYEIVVTNAGPSAATNVEIVDTLPTGVTFVSATGGTVTAPSGGSSDVIVNVGNLAVSATATVTITVTANNDAPNSVTNSAIVRSDESENGFDIDTTNNTATEPTPIQSVIDLEIVKSDSADPVVAGESFQYTLLVTNNGPSDATDVVVTDNLPDGIRVTAATSTVGTVTTPASAQDTTAANNDDLTVAIPSLASGASATVTITATVLPGTRGTLTNTSTVATTNTSLVETLTTNNSDSESTALTAEVDLVVTKTDGTDPVVAGNNLVYTIVVTNDGPSTANSVTLTDTLPTGVTFVSATSTQGTVTNSGGTLTGALGTLAPSASTTITVTTTVNAATRGSITNTASVTATETETDSTNNSASAVTTVNGSADLQITKTDGLTVVAADGSLTYTIVVTNTGPSTATNVVVTDTLPATLAFTSGTTTVGAVTNTGNAVTVNVGTLAPNATATITLNADVLATATGTINNTATVTATEDTTGASASDSTNVAELASISGLSYLDANKNDVFDTGDSGVSGVTIALSGTDILGNTVNRTTTTDANGNYSFTDLLPGTYTLTQTQPEGLGDGAANVGTGATATAGTNQITTINLQSGVDATAFNFGDIVAALSKRRFLASTT